MMLKGHAHNFEKNLVKLDWSHDDKLLTVGSADRLVYVWNTIDGSLRTRMAGHRGHINAVRFAPPPSDRSTNNSNQYKLASGSSDKTI